MSRFLFIFLTNFCAVYTFKILAVFPHCGKSHVDVFMPLTKELARRGHEVTVISHFPLKKPMRNYRDIRLGDNNSQFVDILSMDLFENSRFENWLATQPLTGFLKFSCKIGLESVEFKKFLEAEETFDLVIVEFFNSYCFLGVVEKFGAPFIAVSSSTILHWHNKRFANPTNPSYIPENLMDYSHEMDFFQRTENFIIGIFRQFIFDFVMNRYDQEFARNTFGDLPPLGDIAAKASLFLVNSHFSLNLPRPLVPAVIEIGGIHIGNLSKIPNNLEKWINESTDGVIYFSLGSMIKGHTFPEEKRQEFLKAFGRLPQRVLWKYENETMPGKPDNVMIQKWMPQLDILCHPNVKAFISHGGLLGTTEAVHCGVPVMVMPQYGDQFTNAKALEANGGGVILHLYEATEEKVYNGLKTILDPKFKRQAEDLSARFRDRPLPPLETAIYWVEYVARHRGAPHLRTAAVGMPLYKYLLLDVIAFLLLVFALIAAIFFYVARAVFRKLFQCKKDKQKTN